MAESTTLTGRLDTPMASALIVLCALAALFALHKITISVG